MSASQVVEAARASRGVRAGAAATVDRLARRLADAAVPAFRPFDLWKGRLPAPELLPVGVRDAVRAAEDLRSLVRWVDDGECFSRAVVGVERLEELLGSAAAGPAQASHGAVAYVPTSMRRTGWSFHAATAFRSAEDDAIHVIDHLQGARTGRASGIFSLDEWAELVGRRASDVRIQDELDNIPTGGGPITAPATPRSFRGMANRLVRSFDRGS